MTHSLAFAVLATGAVLATPYLEPASSIPQLLAILAAVAVLGVPHGSLDVVYASRSYKLYGPGRWLAFIGLYVAAAGIVVLTWLWVPLAFLIGFLAISARHFAGDLRPGSGVLLRIAHGLAPIVLPAYLHGEELTLLFGHLIPAEEAGRLVTFLAGLAPVNLVAILLALVWEPMGAAGASGGSGTRIEVLATASMALLADPLVAFAVYFCGLHSVRHVRRTGHLFSLSRGELLVHSIAPTVGCLLLGALAFFAIRHAPPETVVLQVTFVGLAGLTVPHMMLVEPRLRATW